MLSTHHVIHLFTRKLTAITSPKVREDKDQTSATEFTPLDKPEIATSNIWIEFFAHGPRHNSFRNKSQLTTGFSTIDDDNRHDFPQAVRPLFDSNCRWSAFATANTFFIRCIQNLPTDQSKLFNSKNFFRIQSQKNQQENQEFQSSLTTLLHRTCSFTFKAWKKFNLSLQVHQWHWYRYYFWFCHEARLFSRFHTPIER